ncbi:hypothetical protein B0J12DRAFT_66207 [Macrophomina phaseolina]|uniref:Homeodomain-like protein n=1 Tax=Macrophomina phaseolina TaxID=35725 RepID=A0ABQ8GCX4_9PEZI|nr:hypothetical protein B0J12DRAFT_66207 [Macrophomina phaseolina]
MSDVDDANGSQHDESARDNLQEARGERTDLSAHEGDNEISEPESRSRLQLKKRKQHVAAHDARAKRLRVFYRDEYRQFYNSAITESTSFDPEGNPGRLEPSQIGASKWTVVEKQRLFVALGRYGKDDMPKITSAVRTKSEPEIRELLVLLQEGVVELHINSGDVSKTAAFHEIPAACEISEDCCRSLEATADALASLQDSWDAKQEQKRHGKHWILTPDMAKLLDRAIEEEGGDDRLTDDDQGYSTGEPVPDDGLDEEDEDQGIGYARDALRAVPAARLLRLSKWLELSARVFANAGGARETENWRSISESGEPPSIFHTAFSDFHRLAVSLTQRLVAASLSQANSRLHARNGTADSRLRKPVVQREDVLAALEMLNIPRSAKSFWVKAPRRCGVIVQQKENTIPYDEAEKILDGQPNFHEAVANISDVKMCEGFAPTETQTIEQPLLEAESIDSDDPNTKQEAYADLFDAQRSYEEEEKLWQLLSQEAPPTIPKELPRRPRVDRKMGDELLDWRRGVDFEAVWERYGRLVDSTSPENMDASTSAPVNRGFETIKSPSPLIRARSEYEDNGKSALPSYEDEGDSPGDAALPIAESDGEEVSDASEVEGNQEGGTHPSSLPIRRVLAPRRARDAATSSMGEMPPYPEDDDDSSADNYDSRSQQASE